MRKLLTLLAAVLLTANVFAQAPQKMSYQAVIRNSGGTLVTSTQIGMEINIRQGSPTGTVVYTETQTPTTNANGLVSIEIGGGAGFNTINWGTSTYFIETKTALVAPLTTYTITGVSQLLSVPYALNAKTADNGITSQQASDIIANNAKVGITTAQADAITANTAKVGITNVQSTKLAGIADGAEVNVQADWNQATTTADDYIKNKPTIPTAADGSETKVTAGTNVTVTGSGTTASPYVINATSSGSGTRYLGEEYDGGIIFYLYTDNTGTQKGLIVSKTEHTALWQNTGVLVNANKTSNGSYNMNLMTNSPARTWVETILGAGWYLPSIDELSLLWHNRFHVNNSSASGLTLLSSTAYYWSSTEYTATSAFFFMFINGTTNIGTKTSSYNVRGVRAF